MTDPTPPTIITLTLPTPEGGGIAPERATATLLIQRGDLAHVKQFDYHGDLPVVMDAIRQATEALNALVDNPPVVPDLPPEKPKSKTAKTAADDGDPTVDVPLKKGTRAVKARYIQIADGTNDTEVYRQALSLAGRFIDSGLCDGTLPYSIGIHTVWIRFLDNGEQRRFAIQYFERDELYDHSPTGHRPGPHWLCCRCGIMHQERKRGGKPTAHCKSCQAKQRAAILRSYSQNISKGIIG